MKDSSFIDRLISVSDDVIFINLITTLVLRVETF